MTTMTASEPIAPPSAPLLTHMTVAPEPDDIPDPAVPAAVVESAATGAAPAYPHDAILHAFCARVQVWMLEYHKSMVACLEATLEPVRQCLTQAAAGNEHAQYQLADALLKMQEHGIRVQTTPYVATVHATSPQGYGLDVQIQKVDAQELVDALTSLLSWLKDSGFTGVQVHTS